MNLYNVNRTERMIMIINTQAPPLTTPLILTSLMLKQIILKCKNKMGNFVSHII